MGKRIQAPGGVATCQPRCAEMQVCMAAWIQAMHVHPFHPLVDAARKRDGETQRLESKGGIVALLNTHLIFSWMRSNVRMLSA